VTSRPEPPKPYLDACGCIITTEGQIEHLPFFEKRVKTRIKTVFCDDCRVKYGGASMTQDTSFRVKCSACRFYFWMGVVAWIGWMVSGFLLMQAWGG